VSGAYRDAGVDTEAAAKAVALIGDLAAQVRGPDVLEGVGGFAGLYRTGGGKLLAAATDGVGTKVEIARGMGRLDTVGIDLVAMCADDVVCTGAEPLFFLDYIAVGKVVPERVASLVEGVVEGCRRAGCALLGGETAEHPGVMDPDAFDMAGFCVGSVDEDALLGPERVRAGDVLIGLAASGLHANGYSLIRRLFASEDDLRTEHAALGRSLGDELLEPCAIYAQDVLPLARDGVLHAAAHITGGGFFENIPRALPAGLGAEIRRGSWPELPIFGIVAQAGGVSDDDLFATFNMGIGMVLVVSESDADDVLGRFPGKAFAIGRVTEVAGLRIG
jgi:phosphoribosylformylglycinamidine cyclo-ligase